MGATFSRLKTWITEKLNSADINAEFDNILDNFTPAGMDDMSLNESAMQTQTDPGTPGSPSLPTDLAGEIERLRYEIAAIKGETYWYNLPDTTLASLNTQFSAVSSNARLVSGQTTSNSAQSYLITPAGEGNGEGFTVNATTTTLRYSIGGVEYSVDTDITQATTAAAPTTNNTATVDAAYLADQEWTRFYGTYGGGIPVDSVGANIIGRDGVLAAYRLNNGSTNEYFLGVYNSSASEIQEVVRGIGFDENGAGYSAITFADNDTITLMRINHVFLDTSGTLSITQNEPVVGNSEPASPATGDYWFDISTQEWKSYDGATYNSSNAVYLGYVICDENDNCVAARSMDFYKIPTGHNSLEVINDETDQDRVMLKGSGAIEVYGNLLTVSTRTEVDSLDWDDTDLVSGTAAADQMYFMYITEEGVPKLDTEAPMDLRATRLGLYHPYETWRCVGFQYRIVASQVAYCCSLDKYRPNTSYATSTTVGSATSLDYYCSPFKPHGRSNGQQNPIYVPYWMSLDIPTGATLDHQDGVTDSVVLHVCVPGAGGVAVELAVSSHQHLYAQDAPSAYALDATSDAGFLYALTGAGASDERDGAAVAYGKVSNTTAGTWASSFDYFVAPDDIQLNRRKEIELPATTYTSASGRGNPTTLNFLLREGRNINLRLSTDSGVGLDGYILFDNIAGTSATVYYGVEYEGSAGDRNIATHAYYHQLSSGTLAAVYVPVHLDHTMDVDDYVSTVTGAAYGDETFKPLVTVLGGGTASFEDCRFIIEEKPIQSV